MKKEDILKIAAFFAIFAVFISGCSQSLQQKPAAEKQEEITDTGILSIKSIPSPAQVYINEELKGKTPLELYNIPVGTYKIVVKKDGYSDYEGSADVKVGMTEEVEASLSPIESNISIQEKSTVNLPSQKLKIANISNSFIVYYDFKNELFTPITSGSPDTFSSNYETYIYFTAVSPSTMRVVNKQIKDVKKEDCAYVTETIANLYSGQTLCIKTKDGSIAAIGGKWENKADKLEWELFS